jgi:hypothetical protein
MAYRLSRFEELAKMRARGQRPEIMVVVGDSAAAAWASRNRFFFVPEREIGDELTAFAGLHVLVRTPNPHRLREQIQRLALNAAFVMVFDTAQRRMEYLAA